MKRSSRFIPALLSLLLGVSAAGCSLFFAQNRSADGAQSPRTDATDRPNIVVVLADDMGYSDIGSYGGEIETPNLDRLAREGLRFTQFYNTARCVPTRASLLTGLYAHQAGLGHMINDDEIPGYRGDLNRRSVTIAEVLGEAGYSTYMSGKWHVTPYSSENPEKHNWPLQRGFDRFFGTIIGAGSYYDPASLVRGNEHIAPHEAGDSYTNDNFYYTTAISDYAVRYIDSHAANRQDNPFFMYVAYTAPHWPLHAPEEAVQRYEGAFDEGWDQLRQKRYQRMKEMGLIKEEWDLTKRDPQVPSWDRAENKRWQQRRMEVYAAQVDLMDRGIGRIVDALERAGELENTLLLFLADNGGCQENLGWIEWRDYQAHEGIAPPGRNEPQPRPRPRVTRDGQPVQHGNMPEYMPGGPNTFQSYARPWANLSNTPFREYKHLVHEGGIATPLIVHWPAEINRAGELERQPGHVIDLMATFVDVAGGTYPSTYAGNMIYPMQGTSLVPAFHGNDIDRGEPLFFEHEGNRALRDGRWKIVAKGASQSWELYDMNADRTETNDLADRYPERLKNMAQTWESMARRFNAIPWPYGGKFGLPDE